MLGASLMQGASLQGASLMLGTSLMQGASLLQGPSLMLGASLQMMPNHQCKFTWEKLWEKLVPKPVRTGKRQQQQHKKTAATLADINQYSPTSKPTDRHQDSNLTVVKMPRMCTCLGSKVIEKEWLLQTCSILGAGEALVVYLIRT